MNVLRVLAAAALVTVVVAVAKRQSPHEQTDLTMSDPPPTVTAGALAVPRQRSSIEPRLATEPSAPYRAGQTVTFRAPLGIVDDYSNDMPVICFDWGEHEACDPAAWGRVEGGRRDGDNAVWTGTLPGWVTAPNGLHSCEELGCRLTIIDHTHAHISTPVLRIDAGPAPKPLADISIRSDGSIELRSPGIAPDASWTAWAAGSSAGSLSVQALAFSLCVFADYIACDPFVRNLPTVPVDGRPFTLVLPSRRWLLTPLTTEGWIDCSAVVCVVRVSRAAVVPGSDGSVAVDMETVLQLPYQLPASSPVAPRPQLSITTPPPYEVGQTVHVVLENLPSDVGEADTLQLLQCPTPDPRPPDPRRGGCRSQFQTWQRDATGESYSTDWKMLACTGDNGCTLAFEPLAKGWPPAATTPIFTVADTRPS